MTKEKSCSHDCFKISNPIRNLLLPVIVFVIVDKLFGYLFYEAMFKNVWMEYESVWRPMEGSICAKMSVVAAFYALLISFFYTKLCEKMNKRICIFGFAFAVFLIGRFIGEVYGYILYPYSAEVMLLGLAHGFSVIVAWAIISKKIFVVKE